MVEDQQHRPDETPDAGAPEAPKAKPEPKQEAPAPTVHVAPSPHLTDQAFTTRRMMTDVLIALSPLLIVAVVMFGWFAVYQIGLCLLSCLTAEALFTWLRHKPVTLHDNSAAVTALILAFSLPATAPWYVSVIGSFVAIGLGKIVFGGLGMNIFNPAMVGRAFVMMAFVGSMAGPRYVLDLHKQRPDDTRIITQATPMTVMKREKGAPTPSPEQVMTDAIKAAAANEAGGDEFSPSESQVTAELKAYLEQPPSEADPTDVAAIRKKVTQATVAQAEYKRALGLGGLFWGTTNGSLGEVSALACLVGGLFLCVRKTASWQIPAGAVGAVVVIAGLGDLLVGSPMTMMHHLLGGAFLFGAFFIATDPVSSPITPKGRLIFGVIFGALVMLLRNLSAYPEGVMFAILLVNAFAPLINRWTIPTPVGGAVPEKKS